jgi:hypothetical protein
MDTDSIDASIGLEFSLELFKEYKANGTLQAKFLRVPGMPKNSIASLQLVEGAVVACFVEERNGQRQPITRAMLVQLDNERGPFEWKFHRAAPASSPPPVTPAPQAPLLPPISQISQASPISQIPPISQFSPASPFTPIPSSTNRQQSQRLPYAVPKIVARLNWIQLRSWSYEQRQAVYLVWQLIDGKRTVQEIYMALSNELPAARVNEVLKFLFDIKVITIQ